MTTLHERVMHLEASVFRTEDHERAQRAAAEQVAERVEAFTGHAAHLRDGIDTVSGDLRALTNEVHAEVLPRLDRVEQRLDSMDRRLGSLETGMAALLAHFNISVPPAS